MSMYRKLMTVGCAAVLALGLAACGGGGDDDDTADGPTVTEPTGPTQAELDAEKERADEAERKLAEAEAAAALATAKALIAALDARATFVDPPLADSAQPFVRQVRASYGKAPTVAVRDDSTATADRTPPFSATDDPADSISGWAGYNYSRKDRTGGGSAEMVVYTNVEMPVSKPFTEVHGQAADADNSATDKPLEIGSTYLIANIAKVASPGFAAQGAKTHGPADLSFDGTFDGAPGTYSCTGTCTSTRDDDGALSISTGWTFTADSGAMTSVADADHLHFGWWLRKDADGDPAWVYPFAGGSTTAIANAAIGAAVGAATYKGGAAGKYAIRSLGGTTGGGHWTAMSELTAKFGSNADAGSVSGKIYSFMVGGEEMPWEVTLGNDADLSDGVGGTGIATTWKIGGEAAQGGTGTWSGNFYNATARTETQPSGIAGTFDANFGSSEGDHTGRMTGAFGATRE